MQSKVWLGDQRIGLTPSLKNKYKVAGVETVVENVATEVQQENVATYNGPVTDAVSRQV